MKKLIFILTSIFLKFISFAQEEPQKSVNFHLGLDYKHYAEEGLAVMGIGYEWIPVSWFGIEPSLKAGVGMISNDQSVLDEKFYVKGTNFMKGKCNFESLCFTPRGYFPISKEKNNCIYLGLPLNLYFIQATGSIISFSNETYNSKGGFGPYLSLGIEVGIHGELDENIDIKAYLGGGRYKYHRAINQLYFGVENELTRRFQFNNYASLRFGVIFSFKSVKRDKRNK